ncbi:MAG: hypothetical protein ACRDNK_00675, partial [Solirubrobacteraceae bacterium]
MSAREEVGAGHRPSRPGRLAYSLMGAALAAAAVVGVLGGASDHWRLVPLVMIAGFTIASDRMGVDVGRTVVSGSFLGIVLAAVLLGSGPAALIGAVTIVVGWSRMREAPHWFWSNLANFIWFPLIAGLFFTVATHGLHVTPRQLGFYLLVFATFLLAFALNILLAFGYRCYVERSSLSEQIREIMGPLMAAELFSSLLTLAAVYVAIRVGTAGLALFGLV